MAHCSIYVKMKKGPKPGKFSLTTVLLTFSDLSHSQQTETLSSGHIHYCCFWARYSLITLTSFSTGIPWTMQASSRDSIWEDGHPMQCIPAPIKIWAIFSSTWRSSPMSISFEICMINPPFTFEICWGQFSTIVSGTTDISPHLPAYREYNTFFVSWQGGFAKSAATAASCIPVWYRISSLENTWPHMVTIMKWFQLNDSRVDFHPQK